MVVSEPTAVSVMSELIAVSVMLDLTAGRVSELTAVPNSGVSDVKSNSSIGAGCQS